MSNHWCCDDVDDWHPHVSINGVRCSVCLCVGVFLSTRSLFLHIITQRAIHTGSVNPLTTIERQSARVSKITNDGLRRSVTGCFI